MVIVAMERNNTPAVPVGLHPHANFTKSLQSHSVYLRSRDRFWRHHRFGGSTAVGNGRNIAYAYRRGPRVFLVSRAIVRQVDGVHAEAGGAATPRLPLNISKTSA